MITKERLMKMNGRGELHCDLGHQCERTVGPKGAIRDRVMRVRLTSKIRLWKKRPKYFEQPVRYGLNISIIITPDNAHMFHHLDDCPIEKNVKRIPRKERKSL